MERSDYLRKFTWIKNYLCELQNQKKISSEEIEKLIYHISNELNLQLESVEKIKDPLPFLFYEDKQ